MSEIPITAIDQIVRQQECIADLERKLAKSQDGEAILWSQLAERDEWLACANAKLSKCRMALEKLEEVGILCQRAEESRYSEARVFARETLEQTK